MEKTIRIILNALPVLVMIALIPLVKNDYLLVLIYAVFIWAVFSVRKIKKNDIKVFILGLCVMTIFEAIFISTGVETFNRNTLLGIMPIWLPLLWAYGFVAIKRTLEIIDE